MVFLRVSSARGVVASSESKYQTLYLPAFCQVEADAAINWTSKSAQHPSINCDLGDKRAKISGLLREVARRDPCFRTSQRQREHTVDLGENEAIVPPEPTNPAVIFLPGIFFFRRLGLGCGAPPL
jgi:hypothetical protein